jgi:hypothetical protein
VTIEIEGVRTIGICHYQLIGNDGMHERHRYNGCSMSFREREEQLTATLDPDSDIEGIVYI